MQIRCLYDRPGGDMRDPDRKGAEPPLPHDLWRALAILEAHAEVAGLSVVDLVTALQRRRDGQREGAL